MHPDERAVILDALDLTEAMTRHRNALVAAGELDPGPAAALEAVRAGAAAPARGPVAFAGFVRDDAAEREAAISKAAREVCDMLVGWCDPNAKVPTKEQVDELFRKLSAYEEARSGQRPDWKLAAFAARLQQSAAAPAGMPVEFTGRGGRRFSLAQALAPVHVCGSVVVAPAGSPEIAKW